MPLPANIGHGTVTGKIIAAQQQDASDTDIDAVPVAGKVTFTPSAPLAIHEVDDLIIALKPVVVDLDGTGAFTVQLIATDDMALNPYNWTYKVSFALTGGAMADIHISVPEGSTQDISDLAPVPAANGQYYLVGPEGMSAYEVWVEAGNVGTEADFFDAISPDPTFHVGPTAPADTSLIWIDTSGL